MTAGRTDHHILMLGQSGTTALLPQVTLLPLQSKPPADACARQQQARCWGIMGGALILFMKAMPYAKD